MAPFRPSNDNHNRSEAPKNLYPYVDNEEGMTDMTHTYRDPTVVEFNEQLPQHSSSMMRPRRSSGSCFYKLCFALGWIIALILSVVLIVHKTKAVVGPSPSTITSTDDFFEFFLVRINCGATEPYVDPDNSEWLPDSNSYEQYEFTSQGDSGTHDYKITSISDVGAEGPGLYLNERYFASEGEYTVKVPWNGPYEVTLYFAELFFDSPGQRVFDVYVENQLMTDNFDIITATSGRRAAAATMTYDVDVEHGAVSIRLVSNTEHAKISGIKVASISSR